MRNENSPRIGCDAQDVLIGHIVNASVDSTLEIE